MRFSLFFILIIIFSSFNAHANDVSAIKSAASGKYINASSPLGRDIVQWYKLRNSNDISFREAREFLLRHGDWPRTRDIRRNAEKSITPNIPNGEIITFFSQNPPITANGMTAYINAMLALNQTAQAMQILKNWWPSAVMSEPDQTMMMARFGKYLGSQDHERRIRYIIHDQHYTAARALARHLGNGYPQLIEAKIGLIEQKSNANQLLTAVPAHLRNNEALMLARIQWRRKNDNDNGAIELLNRAPSANQLSNPKDWWTERHIMARRLMEDTKWGSAYELVSNHRQKEGFALAQAEFLAGWLALRQLGKPWEAFKHFEKLYNNVETPISKSRGAYWAGLASDALGYKDIATQWYQVAAKHQTTFYGQMAAQRINLPLALLNETPIQVTAEARQTFRQNPYIAGALLLHQSGQRGDSQMFLIEFAEGTKRSGLDYRLAAELADSLGHKDTTVKIAKEAEKNGYLMPRFLFPVLPEAKTKSYAIHPAFNHGIMRQESLFDQYAQSHAGALGLMQLMPATARETAKKAGLPYSQSRLTSDPSYNMTLGSLYIKQMLDRFDGNRTLAIAAYNAGPGRVSTWIKEFGDPRDPKIDEADWIEKIPIYETRNYVHRVTEAINVYSRLIK